MNRKRQGWTSGLVIPAVVAALLMAAALVGCSGDVTPRTSVTGVPVRAEAVGQANGSLTTSFPTAGEFERAERQQPVDLRRVGAER
jgi:hypothetical protein